MFAKTVEKELKKLGDEDYISFQNKLSIGNDELKLIGIKNPILRNYAKELSKKYELSYLLENINENYYEEVMLKGMLIGLYKNLEYSQLEEYIRYFTPKIIDWALCDTFVSGLKLTKKYLENIWELLDDYLKSEEEFDIRFSLIMIKCYFISDEYLDNIFDIINNVENEGYYAKMGNAWLISECAIKYYDETYNFLKSNCTVNNWTYNKGIQKSIESSRLTKEQKSDLRKLKK